MRTIIDPRSNTAWRYTLLVGCCALLLPIVVSLVIADKTTVRNFNNVASLLYLLATAVAFGWAAWHTASFNAKLGRAWWMFVVALAFAFLAKVSSLASGWSFMDGFAPIVSVTSYLLFYVIFKIGAYLIPQAKPERFVGLRQLLDSLTVLIATALIIWSFGVAPLLLGQSLDWKIVSSALLLPICSVTSVAALVDLLLHPRLEQPHEPLLLLGFSALLLVLINVGVALQSILHFADGEPIVDFLWLVFCVIAGMTAVLQATTVKNEAKVAVQPQQLHRTLITLRTGLPSLLLLAVYTLMVFSYQETSYQSFLPLSWGVWILIALVSLRQLLIVLENISLSDALRTELGRRQRAHSALQKSNDILEQQVAEHSKELSILSEQLYQNEHKLRHDAFHDKLTTLPNRTFFANFVQYALQVATTNSEYRFAVLFLDFDGFKLVNDSLGHFLGDKLLIALAKRLLRCVTSKDLVARLGGDEFVVLLTGVTEAEIAQTVADYIQKQLHLPFDIDGHRLFTSASIGIVLADAGYSSADDILRDADIAMYKAKAQGKANSVVFATSMRESAIERLRLETELRDAMLEQQFYLHFQPIYELESQQVTGFEALIRWLHPMRGHISPLEFIPIAEETGLIVPIGEWVLREACKQMRAWQIMFPQVRPLTISVNISPYQFRQSNLATVVERILEESELAPTSLKLEITESAFMHDTNSALNSFARLKVLGVQLQLDDFGTGYSSLSYLHRMPISTIKIDRSFVSCISHEGENVEIARTITTLAHNLAMNVIAEGVETESQMEHIQALGCEQIQGFLISKPLDKGAAERFIVQNLTEKEYALPLWKSIFDQRSLLSAL